MTNSILDQLLPKVPESARKSIIDKAAKPKLIEINQMLKLKRPLYELVDIKVKLAQALKTFIAFQDMCKLSLPNSKVFRYSPASRIAVWNQPTALLKNEYYLGACSINGLLSVQKPCDERLQFLIEKYAKESGTGLPTGDAFFKDAFKVGSETNSKLKEMLYGKIIADRATVTGFPFVGKLFDLSQSKNPFAWKYLNKNLPKFMADSSTYIQGVVQVLNTRLMNTLDMRKRVGCAIPDSITNTCFQTPSSLAEQSYNPFDNSCLNLGKNLFDIEGGIVASGPLAYSDIDNWNRKLRNLYASPSINQDLWALDEIRIPSLNEIDDAIPTLENVWAVSQHFLYHSPNIEKNSSLKNNLLHDIKNQASATVQYALYYENNTTRLLETCELAENTAGSTVCTSLFPSIRSYENPPMYSWMSIAEIDELNNKADIGQAWSDNVQKKVTDATIYYRYLNQNFYPVASDFTLDRLVNAQGYNEMEGQLFQSLYQKWINEGKNSDLGGNFANNIFEKNFKILSESQPDNVRIDAINLVADDNSRFMDVRLPACFYEVKNAAGQSVQKPTSIDYAMGYSTNSNVVLISRTILNDSANQGLALSNGYNYSSDAEMLAFDNMVNFNTSFALNAGNEFASQIRIERNHPMSPKRLILDALYTLLSDQMRKHVKIARDNGNRNRRWDKIREYSDPYYDNIVKSKLLNPNRPGPNRPGVFKTPYINYKNKGFINLLRGTLYDASTLAYGQSHIAEAESKDFLTKRAANELTDPLVDSFFYLNSSTFKPYTQTEAAPIHQDIYLTSGDGRIWNDGDSVKREIEVFGPNKLAVGSESKYRQERDRRKVALAKSKYDSTSRAKRSDGSNLDATLPFIANGIRAFNAVKANQKIFMYEPMRELDSCYARCFDPYTSKDLTLETLYFYHKAAIGNGAPLGRMIDNLQLPSGVVSNRVRRYLNLNPYSCLALPRASMDISPESGVNLVKSYETKYMLRKEYYAMRFMALLGTYLSRLLDDPNTDLLVSAEPDQTIVYENVFGSLGYSLLGSFNGQKQTDAYRYFEALIKGSSENPKQAGDGFIKMCFFETKPLEALLNSYKKLSGRVFVYANSRTMNIAECLRSGSGEAFLNDPKSYAKAGLMEYIIKNILNIKLDAGKIIPDEYKQRAYLYVCSLSDAERSGLVTEYQAYLQMSTTVQLATIIPGSELNPEVKRFLCSLKKAKTGKGIPFIPVKDPDAVINYLSKVYADAGVNLLEKMNELDCEGDAFTQEEIEESRGRSQSSDEITEIDNQEPIIDDNRGQAVVMESKLEPTKGTSKALVYGLVGATLATLVGYGIYKSRKKRRIK